MKDVANLVYTEAHCFVRVASCSLLNFFIFIRWQSVTVKSLHSKQLLLILITLITTLNKSACYFYARLRDGSHQALWLVGLGVVRTPCWVVCVCLFVVVCVCG
jgi:hypothetical protein